MDNGRRQGVRMAVLGATGMLGAMVAAKLAATPGVTVEASTRRPLPAGAGGVAVWHHLDAATATPDDLRWIGGCALVVNAVGVIRQRLDESDPAAVAAAVRVNALFPLTLAEAAARVGVPVVQIATDCVYSGRQGPYDETAPHDPADVYGQSKALGERTGPAVVHVRCSIVGPESGGVSLLGWLRSQPRGARLTGFTNHLWNGVTTLAFARLAAGLALGGELPDQGPPYHWLPADAVSKAQLLRLFAQAHGRDDLTIDEAPAPVAVDRRLSTRDAARNAALWAVAGYAGVPTVADLVAELAADGAPLFQSFTAGMQS